MTSKNFVSFLSAATILVIFFFVSLSQLPAPEPPKTVIVTKIIDGDTLVVQGGDHVRLLGIDTDERGEPCYTPAKNRLTQLLLNQPVTLESDTEDRDQYDRLLRFVFLNYTNINLQLVKEGLAIARFYPENQKYKPEIQSAEKTAINNKTGCKWSNP